MRGDTVDWVGVGQRLRKIRKDSRLSQREFGRRFNVSQNMISLYEKGKSHGSVEFYIQVAQSGGKTIEWLLVGCEDRTTETLREMLDLHDRMKNSLGVVRQLLDRESASATDERLINTQDGEALRQVLQGDPNLPRCLRECVEDPAIWQEVALTGREAWAIRATVRAFGEWDLVQMKTFLQLIRQPPAEGQAEGAQAEAAGRNR